MKPARIPASRSRENYLKALLQLRTGQPVAVSVLARHLRVSAPSVTNMLARLAEERLVTLGARGAAELSADGERAALQVLRRHRLLETFLVRVLELDWSEVHEDAEELEHHVSERVLDALDRFMGHPTDDPHGHPIPDRRGRLERRALEPLASLPAGSRAQVREVRGGDDRARMARWKRSGLVPGARVRMLEANAEDGVYTLEIAGRRLVSSRDGLEGVLIDRRARENS
ncbi:MAG: metal-dependent transcriptional regulator [Candidatus Eisenbacteria bacterium]